MIFFFGVGLLCYVGAAFWIITRDDGSREMNQVVQNFMASQKEALQVYSDLPAKVQALLVASAKEQQARVNWCEAFDADLKKLKDKVEWLEVKGRNQRVEKVELVVKEAIPVSIKDPIKAYVKEAVSRQIGTELKKPRPKK